MTPEDFEAAITPETRAIVCESIVNPCATVMDLAGIAAVARRHGLPLVVDNTLASPALIRPIEHGADIVIHSTSKFLGGSGQTIGGVICDAGRFDWARTGRLQPDHRALAGLRRPRSDRALSRRPPSPRPAGSSACATSAPACRR